MHLDAARVGHDVVQQRLLRLVLQRLLDGLAVAGVEARRARRRAAAAD